MARQRPPRSPVRIDVRSKTIEPIRDNGGWEDPGLRYLSLARSQARYRPWRFLGFLWLINCWYSGESWHLPGLPAEAVKAVPFRFQTRFGPLLLTVKMLCCRPGRNVRGWVRS